MLIPRLIKALWLPFLLVWTLGLTIQSWSLTGAVRGLVDDSLTSLRLQHQFQGDLVTLQRRCDTQHQEWQRLQWQFAEFQQWRIHLTAASRMGWSRANRYMREFPLRTDYRKAMVTMEGQ